MACRLSGPCGLVAAVLPSRPSGASRSPNPLRFSRFPLFPVIPSQSGPLRLPLFRHFDISPRRTRATSSQRRRRTTPSPSSARPSDIPSPPQLLAPCPPPLYGGKLSDASCAWVWVWPVLDSGWSRWSPLRAWQPKVRPPPPVFCPNPSPLPLGGPGEGGGLGPSPQTLTITAPRVPHGWLRPPRLDWNRPPPGWRSVGRPTSKPLVAFPPQKGRHGFSPPPQPPPLAPPPPTQQGRHGLSPPPPTHPSPASPTRQKGRTGSPAPVLSCLEFTTFTYELANHLTIVPAKAALKMLVVLFIKYRSPLPPRQRPPFPETIRWSGERGGGGVGPPFNVWISCRCEDVIGSATARPSAIGRLRIPKPFGRRESSGGGVAEGTKEPTIRRHRFISRSVP